MEFLYPDLNLNLNNSIPAFRQPNTREIQQWIRETSGVWSRELLKWLGRQLPPENTQRVVKYTGGLSLAQQWWIICDLQDY